jgi:hypothetical protein
MLPKKKKKREESAPAHWCFKVCSPCGSFDGRAGGWVVSRVYAPYMRVGCWGVIGHTVEEGVRRGSF